MYHLIPDVGSHTLVTNVTPLSKILFAQGLDKAEGTK